VARDQLGPKCGGVRHQRVDGEATGGVIIMRTGKNALQTIDGVRDRVTPKQPASGVEIVPTHDRSIPSSNRSKTWLKLLGRILVAAVVCFRFYSTCVGAGGYRRCCWHSGGLHCCTTRV
jgi:Cu(I)/Ag(I) efflux system membrane protein CusA/SilA